MSKVSFRKFIPLTKQIEPVIENFPIPDPRLKFTEFIIPDLTEVSSNESIRDYYTKQLSESIDRNFEEQYLNWVDENIARQRIKAEEEIGYRPLTDEELDQIEAERLINEM